MANRQDSETQLSGLIRVRKPGAFNLICDANIRRDHSISKYAVSERQITVCEMQKTKLELLHCQLNRRVYPYKDLINTYAPDLRVYADGFS